MSTPLRIAICVALGLFFGLGKMGLDKHKGREWVVSPQQIAEARAAGKMGVTTRPGTIAVAPIRSEIADALPFSWLLFGFGGMVAGWAITRRKPPAA